jgi:hypothetical protein
LKALPLALAACLAVAVAPALARRIYDLDGDGIPDSVSLGRYDLHLLITRGGGRGSPATASEQGRLYRMPPDYVHLLVTDAFDWDSRWERVRSDAGTRQTEARRAKDRARVAVRVTQWRGWAVVTVTVLEDGGHPDAEVSSAVFQCLESVFFNGIDTPLTVRGFVPPAD